MLLTIATATIAMLAVRVILSASKEDVSRTELYLAISKSEVIHEKVKAELILDPQIIYKKVLENEPDRICYGENDTLYSENQQWPESCGSYWGYAQPDGESESVLKVTPPTPSNQNLVVTVVSTVGATAAGLRSEYRISPLSSPNVYSSNNLNLSELGANSVIKGVVYSNSELTYSSNIESDKAILASESNITNSSSVPSSVTAKIDDRRLLSGDPSENEKSVRLLYKNPIPIDSLRSAATVLEKRNCSALEPKNITVNGTSRSTALCLKAGSKIVKTDNLTTTVPNAKAYLILPNASQEEDATVDIYVRTTDFQYPDCSNCDLITESNSSISSATHPGVLASWSKIATSFLPAGGYIITDKDTHLGLCGVNFTSEEACSSINSTSPGVKITDPFVLVVGSIDTPRNLYISGPINLNNNSKPAGALVTGQVRIPYWASPRSKDLTVSIDLGVISSQSKPAIESFPRQASSQSLNSSGALTIKGKILAENLNISISSNLYSTHSWDQSLVSRNGTLLPSPTMIWSSPKVRRMSASEISSNI